MYKVSVRKYDRQFSPELFVVLVKALWTCIIDYTLFSFESLFFYSFPSQ